MPVDDNQTQSTFTTENTTTSLPQDTPIPSLDPAPTPSADSLSVSASINPLPQGAPTQPLNTAPPLTNIPQGLSAAEMNDPNNIRVTIPDSDAPIVILFGPPACGKTMTLVRLTRFLKGKGYTVSPERSFRPSYDENYKTLCDTFDETMNSDNAAASTDFISFLLVKVFKAGRCICQILEAPGEHYFGPMNPNAPFPTYINTISNNGKNRKVWLIMVEPNWLNEQDRRNYVSRIGNLKKRMRPKDSAVFVFNKIDLAEDLVISPGQVRVPEAIKRIKGLYPGIFGPFENQNPITKIFKEFNCEFVPFQTGTYTPNANGVMKFQDGADEYCVNLWDTILKKIRG